MDTTRAGNGKLAQPTPYDRQTSFAREQAVAPTRPPNGRAVDSEFQAVKRCLDEILANLAILQRDDTALANRSVGYDQLKLEVQLGFNEPRPWLQDVQFARLDTTFYDGAMWRAEVAHTAGMSFYDDVAAGYWRKLIDFRELLDQLDLVKSVHGRNGDVVAQVGDYDSTEITRPVTPAETVEQALIRLQQAIGSGGGAVTAVFGRQGLVEAENGDYRAGQIDRDGKDESVEISLQTLEYLVEELRERRRQNTLSVQSLFNLAPANKGMIVGEFYCTYQSIAGGSHLRFYLDLDARRKYRFNVPDFKVYFTLWALPSGSGEQAIVLQVVTFDPDGVGAGIPGWRYSGPQPQIPIGPCLYQVTVDWEGEANLDLPFGSLHFIITEPGIV